MNYKEFYSKFGGSARTKAVAPPLPPSKFNNPRPCLMPEESGLPMEFIRMCPWEIEYLYNVARHARRGIVEIGRHNGGSCFVLACASPNVPIYSIDIKPKDDELLRKLFGEHGVGKNVNLIVGDSQKQKYPQVGEFDLLFIDGDHKRQGCSNDIANWYPHLLLNGHLLFHDAFMSTKYGVQEAIIEMMDRHPELQVIQSPFIGGEHWHYPAGSLAHFIKRGR